MIKKIANGCKSVVLGAINGFLDIVFRLAYWILQNRVREAILYVLAVVSIYLMLFR